MGLSHMDIHALERKIADILEKNFSRPPSPHEKSYDSGDFLQMAHDITDMLLSEYFIDTKDRKESPIDRSLSNALETAAWGMEKLARTLNDIAYLGHSDSKGKP